jgi:hypothetical protein
VFQTSRPTTSSQAACDNTRTQLEAALQQSFGGDARPACTVGAISACQCVGN